MCESVCESETRDVGQSALSCGLPQLENRCGWESDIQGDYPGYELLCYGFSVVIGGSGRILHPDNYLDSLRVEGAKDHVV